MSIFIFRSNVKENVMKFLCAILLLVVSACSVHDKAIVNGVDHSLKTKISNEIVKIRSAVPTSDVAAPNLTSSVDRSSIFTPSFRFVPVAHCQD